MPEQPEVTNKAASILDRLKERYQAKASPNKVNFLIYSRVGVGKTYLLKSLPKPFLLHSFDPGGPKCLQEEIEKGECLVDRSFEDETSKKRTAFTAWIDEFNKCERDGVFNEVTTYVIDSGTRWLDALMNHIAQKQKRPHGEVQIQDYNAHQIFAADYLVSCCSIPCNFVFLGHLDSYKDEAEGRVHFSLLASGKSKVKIPALFDEFLYLEAVDTSKGVERRLLTQISGKHEARTRIGAGKFSMYEPPDLRAYLKKAGYPWEDKK